MINPRIIQILCLVVSVIIFGIGYDAHFNNLWKDFLRKPDFSMLCKMDDKCPHESKTLEKGFLSLVGICIVLTLGGLFLDAKKNRFIAIGCTILMLIAGILMITSALKVDKFCKRILAADPEIGKQDLRTAFKYMNKLAAGWLAIINAVLYALVIRYIKVGDSRATGKVSVRTKPSKIGTSADDSE